MQMTPYEQRKIEHAKLFNTDHGQVVAFYSRDENDVLTVLLQCWVACTDEQLRACVTGGHDDETQEIFDALTDEGVGQIMREIGMVDMIEAVEADHG